MINNIIETIHGNYLVDNRFVCDSFNEAVECSELIKEVSN